MNTDNNDNDNGDDVDNDCDDSGDIHDFCITACYLFYLFVPKCDSHLNSLFSYT